MDTGPKNVNIAIIQPLIKFGKKKENLEHILELMKNAVSVPGKALEESSESLDIIIIPETPFLGWIASNSKEFAEPAFGEGAVIVNSLREFAKINSIMVCSGFTEKLANAVYNSAVLIDKTGEVLYVHRKNNIVGNGTQVYTPGTQLCVIPTSVGRIGVIICADNFVAWHHQILKRFRCELILTPGAWVDGKGNDDSTQANIASWHDHLKRTSLGVGCPVVGANSIGTLEPGAFGVGRMWGNSIAYQNSETLAAEGLMEQEEIIKFSVQVHEKPVTPSNNPDIFDGLVKSDSEGFYMIVKPPPHYGEPMKVYFSDIAGEYEGESIRMEIHKKTSKLQQNI
jgi:predicted amidohydrolase